MDSFQYPPRTLVKNATDPNRKSGCVVNGNTKQEQREFEGRSSSASESTTSNSPSPSLLKSHKSPFKLAAKVLAKKRFSSSPPPHRNADYRESSETGEPQEEAPTPESSIDSGVEMGVHMHLRSNSFNTKIYGKHRKSHLERQEEEERFQRSMSTGMKPRVNMFGKHRMSYYRKQQAQGSMDPEEGKPKLTIPKVNVYGRHRLSYMRRQQEIDESAHDKAGEEPIQTDQAVADDAAVIAIEDSPAESKQKSHEEEQPPANQPNVKYKQLTHGEEEKGPLTDKKLMTKSVDEKNLMMQYTEEPKAIVNKGVEALIEFEEISTQNQEPVIPENDFPGLSSKDIPIIIENTAPKLAVLDREPTPHDRSALTAIDTATLNTLGITEADRRSQALQIYDNLLITPAFPLHKCISADVLVDRQPFTMESVISPVPDKIRTTRYEGQVDKDRNLFEVTVDRDSANSYNSSIKDDQVLSGSPFTKNTNFIKQVSNASKKSGKQKSIQWDEEQMKNKIRRPQSSRLAKLMERERINREKREQKIVDKQNKKKEKMDRFERKQREGYKREEPQQQDPQGQSEPEESLMYMGIKKQLHFLLFSPAITPSSLDATLQPETLEKDHLAAIQTGENEKMLQVPGGRQQKDRILDGSSWSVKSEPTISNWTPEDYHVMLAKKKLKDELAVPIDLVNHQVVDDSDEFDNQKTNMLPNQEDTRFQQFQKRMFYYIHHSYFHIMVIFLVLLDVAVVITEIMVESTNKDGSINESVKLAETILHYLSLFILTVFFIEVMIKIIAYGARILKHRFEIFDTALVVTAFCLDMALEGGGIRDSVELIILLRLWRITKIINDPDHSFETIKRMDAGRDFFWQNLC